MIDKDTNGITNVSLRNIAAFATVHGEVRAIEHDCYTAQQSGNNFECTTVVHFRDGARYSASGFACGYHGEGPRGLVEVITKYLGRTDITPELVATWLTTGTIFMVTFGQGNGCPLARYTGCQDMEFDAIVY